MMEGRIVKGIAGFYYVDVAGSGIYECKARGIFRKEGIKPLTGDSVRITVLDEENKEAGIDEILPRRNSLFRPAVANVDQALLIFSFADPKPNFNILDKFLLRMKLEGLKALIAFNKSEKVTKQEAARLQKTYSDAGYKAIPVSVYNKEGLEELFDELKGKTTVMAGPSGVGKSSIVNYFSPDHVMQTGEISRKLKRGKNTTRHSEMIRIGDGTYLCDTPGFTSFIPGEIKKEEIKLSYNEFQAYSEKCRFPDCNHIDEPDCAVKAAVSEGRVASLRYLSYKEIFAEAARAEKDRY